MEQRERIKKRVREFKRKSPAWNEIVTKLENTYLVLERKREELKEKWEEVKYQFRLAIHFGSYFFDFEWIFDYLKEKRRRSCC